MTTAVGFSGETASASFRAGINRCGELDYYDYFPEEESEPIPLHGHTAAPDSPETEGIGKIVALGRAALTDLCGSIRPRAGIAERTGFYVALPNYSLRQQAFRDVNAEMARPDIAQKLSDEWEGDEEEDPALGLRFAWECEQHLFHRLTHGVGLGDSVSLRRNTYGDQCAFFTALGQATDDLSAGRTERAIVGAIDSYLDPFSLEWGVNNHRVKNDANPQGFSPGEGAAFLELRCRRNATDRGMFISGPEWGDEAGHLNSDAPPLGKGLAHAIELVLTKGKVERPGIMIGNLNGEPYRSRDWGAALHRLVCRFPYLQSLRNWSPAESFGETGCAAPALAIGVADQAFRRRYAKADTVVVWSCSDTAKRAAILLGSPEVLPANNLP